jgi:hypothetical protein
MSYIGATGLTDDGERFDTLQDNIDANASFINTLVGIPDPTHTPIFGINILNPGLFGLVERAEVNIRALQLGEEGIGTNISGIETTISGIETEISGIQGEITAIQTEVGLVQGEVSGLSGAFSTFNTITLPLIFTNIGIADGLAGDALSKANKSLGIWDESGNNTYNKKSGNVGIGKTFGSVLNNKLEVNGNINIPTGSTYRINNEPFNYSHLAGTPPVSSKWTNAMDTATNIYYNTGNVGIGTNNPEYRLDIQGTNPTIRITDTAGGSAVLALKEGITDNFGYDIAYNSTANKLYIRGYNDSATPRVDMTFDRATGNVGIGTTSGIINKLEVGGNLNISAGSKYKINNVNLAFSDLGGTLSYNSLTDKLTQGTNISIVGNVINNTYTLPTASTSVLGGVRVDGSSITINNGVISGANTYVLPTASTSVLGGVKIDGTTININNGVISSASATPQVNSDWTQTNASLKSFIQNKPSAGTNISFAGNTITNTIIGSPTQNIVSLNNNELIIKDKPNSVKEDFVDVPLVNEPYISSPTFTESIRTFTHSGGTEAQTSYTITVGQNTICDILIVGGGGGGSAGHGGGGGAGQLVLINNAILSGTYTIKVGKGGNGSTLSGTSQTMGTLTNGTKGSNSEFGNASINVIAEGGGISVDTTLRNGGSGAGGDGHTPDGGVGGKGSKSTMVDTFSSGTVYSRGNDGADGAMATSTNAGQGGGGGGAGSAGTTGGQMNDSAIGHGGDGLSGISQINYDFKTNFGNYGKLETDGKYWFAGGGAGGTYYINSSVVSNGGKGGGGSTPASANNTKINGGDGLNGTGGGGAGGTAWYGNGGKGGSGIVIIKFKTIVSSAIPEGNPITHKTLNFAYNNNLLFYYRTDESPWSWQEAFNEAVANGRRIPTITEIRNYMTNNPSIFAHWNGTDTWSPVVNPAVANSKDWVQIGTAHGRGFSHTQQLGGYPGWGDGNTTYGQIYFEVVDLSQPNTYTLTVQPGTSIQVNNQPAQYLSGNYAITVGATQSSVLISGFSPLGQTDPYPLQNGSTIAIRYSMLQRITSTVSYKKDGLIKYVPASGIDPTTGTWQILDIDTQPLSQFAGNLPFTRIDGNLPANRLDNIDMSKVATGNLDWSRIASQPALSALSGNLDWSRIASQPALSSLSGNLNWPRINIDTVYLPVDRWITCSNALNRFYLANNATTYIQGYGNTPIEFRNFISTPIAWFNSDGELTCMFETQTTTDSDHIIIRGNTANLARGRYRMLIGHNTFTGFHRCYYEDDEVFNNNMSKEDIDIFKNNYKGRIVISTGKIKTDSSRDIPKTEEEGTEVETKTEWYSLIDKDGIMIEDAIPIVQLCRVKKDKRVYGVLGSPTRSTNNKARLIVNSVGEGAICVCNSNGNIENGDYIQSSDILGYGEKQDDDLLHNYSVAKAVMDCNFELDSPYYQCYELANGVRVALIACTYHCG